MSNKQVFRRSIGNERTGGTERAPRACPACGKRFTPMSDVLWKNALAIHLITSKQHDLSAKEIQEIINKTFSSSKKIT